MKMTKDQLELYNKYIGQNKTFMKYFEEAPANKITCADIVFIENGIAYLKKHTLELNHLIYDFGLFHEVENCIISKRVLTEVENFAETGRRMAEIGRKGGQASAKARGQAPAKADGSADGEARGQQNKKNKRKENKENKNCALSGDDWDKPWDQVSKGYEF